MSPALADVLVHGWSVPPFATGSLLLAAWVYMRGWRVALRTRPRELPPWRAGCFLAGLVSLWIAIASPIDALDDLLLTAHMTQHLMLMSVAPPLIVLGAPMVPLLRGLPRWSIRGILGPLLATRAMHAVRRFLRHPAVGWLGMNVAYLAWHVPAAYELTLRSETVHDCEHACFFFTSVLFWWRVIEPWPSRPLWSRWAMVPYLITADIVNTALSASFAFSGHVWYPTYAQAPRVCRLSPLDDQVAAGALMWVLGSLIYWIPAIGIPFALLSRSETAVARVSGVRVGSR